jgi:hypothetical protein
MFKEFKQYRYVFVTGPQRSGTTICARIIADESGLTYVDEEDFGIHDGLQDYLKGKTGLVVQCPAMARWIHEIAGKDDLVVWMRRFTQAVIKSQQRVNWDDSKERAKYKDVPHLNTARPIVEIKNEYWRMQRKEIANYTEVRYESLHKYNLFVPTGKRTKFGVRQWSK